MIITKKKINDLKINNVGALKEILNPNKTVSDLYFILNKLGRLPSNFDGEALIPLVKHPNDKIRLLAVKNIGKLSDEKYLKLLFEISENDKSSMVRREAISSIGRMRSKKAIPLLISKLSDKDPKIVLQAIRGLLVFKSVLKVKAELKKLINHPNELIKDVIEKEFFPKRKFDPNRPKHAESQDFLKNVAVKGDVLEILKEIPDESIHLTFTSPPYYNARDYSIYQSYEQYLEFLNKVFKEVYRITKEGRFFILNTSPIIIPRVSRQHSSKRYPIPFDIHHYLVKMGWEFIDDIIWIKPEASAKNRNAGFLQHRKPLAYKPNAITEYVMVYRKKTFKLIDWNIHQYNKEIIEKSKVIGEYDTSNVWYIEPTFDKTHSAVFPLDLCNKVIRYYSYIGDLIFDPFAGSGTLGKSAFNLNRYFFLTEISDTYFKRIMENLNINDIFQQEFIPKFYNYKEFIDSLKGE